MHLRETHLLGFPLDRRKLRMDIQFNNTRQASLQCPNRRVALFWEPGMNFNKPPQTYLQQLQILKDRGLLVPDEPRALHCLEHHNYYRISAYRFPLTVQGAPDQFLPGTTFEDLWGLYHFDRTLRQFLSEAVKRVEISVRARWAYVLGHAYGAQAYEDSQPFRNPNRHASALAKLDEELERSDEVFVTHYRQRYGMNRPPIWAACEVMSFGLLSRFYENIKRDRDKKQIANTYGFSIDNLKSLLEHSVYIRNLCAHHSRVWNRRFTITVQLPQSSPAAVIPNLNPAEDRRIYNSLVLLIHMLSVIEPTSTWSKRLLQQVCLFDRKYLPQMGFPSDWLDRPLWKLLAAQ
jgi:abortive infection bacteriophage resistance protein